MMSLSEAVKAGKLDEFVLQEEMRGIGPIDCVVKNGAFSRMIKGRRSEDRTSRLPSDDGSIGIGTPPNIGSYISR
jgi:hypothetical protein